MLKSGKQNEEFYLELWSDLEQGKAWTGHLMNERKDGTPYEEDATISPVLGETGEIVKYVATMRDVTRERRIEQQLRQSEKMESIGQLAGGIAHDLNNIITGINGHMELLMMRTGQNADVAREGALILKSGERAAALIRKILAFSRRQMLRPREIDLRSVLTGMREVLQVMLTDGVELRVVAAPDAGVVKADPSQIEQVVMNLVVNARDAMPDGGAITVELANVALDAEFAERAPGVKPGPYVVLSVTDTGLGMDDETRLRAFEPFFTTKDKSKGTGLGLSTVHGVIQQSGGTVEIESAPGQGTTVRAYLPRLHAFDSSDAEERPTTAPAARHEMETILVVDDEDLVRDFVSTVLREAGYTVIEACDGSEALGAAREMSGRLDLTVTDVVMPGMGGAELARALDGVHPETRVLFMSGYPASAVSDDTVLGPEKHFLAKPFTPVALARKVREVLAACADCGG